MAEKILLGTKQLLELARKKAFDQVNADAFAVPDMSREEIIQSDEFEAGQALRLIRDNGVRVLSTRAWEEYYSTALDGKRSPELLKEYSDLATREIIERMKKCRSST